MAGARTRARDSDRDEAVHVISAAYSDGQLTREEYDERSAQALKARTLGQLDALIRNLQEPGEHRSRATLSRLAGNPQPPRAQAATRSDEQARAATSRYQKWALALGLLSAVAVGGFVLATDGDDPPPLPAPVVETVEEAPVRINHFTADGFDALVDGLERVAGTTTVFSLNMYDDNVTALVPVDATSERFANYGWDGATFRGDPTFGTGSATRRFDLQRVDGSTILRSIESAGELVDGRVVDYEVEVFAADWAPRGHCYTVSVVNQFGDDAELFVSCAGRELGHELED